MFLQNASAQSSGTTVSKTCVFKVHHIPVFRLFNGPMQLWRDCLVTFFTANLRLTTEGHLNNAGG
jgi:hypothetical protein